MTESLLTLPSLMGLLRHSAEEGAPPRLRDGARKAYESIWYAFCESLDGRTPLTATAQDVVDFLVFLGEPGNVDAGGRLRPGRPRSGCMTYQTRAAQLLSRAFKGAVVLGLRADNPAEEVVRQIAFGVPRSAPRALTHGAAIGPEDVKSRIRDAAAAQKIRSAWKVLRNTALISVALDSAAKPAELAELSLGDVQTGRDGLLFLSFPGERRRRVQLGEQSATDLSKWLKEHDRIGFPHQVLFPATASLGRPIALSAQAMYKICRTVLEAAGLKYEAGQTPAGFGVLRNTSLITQWAAGRTFNAVHACSGHSSEVTTRALLTKAWPVAI